MRRVRIERERVPVSDGGDFDRKRAAEGVSFFETHLRHTKGRWAGKPFRLRPDWQKLDVEEIFGRVKPDGTRKIRQVYYEVPKKNGKSEMAAGVAGKLLFADNEPGVEVYGAASDREQSGIVFSVLASMVRRDRELKRKSKIVDSRKRIVFPALEGFYAAISSEVAGRHGYNSHGVIFDEVHAQKDLYLWEALTIGAGDAREQPLIFAITTAGVPGESPVAEMLHEDADQILRGVTPCPDDFYPVIYSAEADAPWDDEEVWLSCNPALGDFLSLDSVRKSCEQAKRRPLEQNMFRRMRLNQWVASEQRWIDLADWDRDPNSREFDWRDLKEIPCFVGVDLSTKLDLTAFVIVWLSEDGVYFFQPHFFIPEDGIKDRPNIEASKYGIWLKKGYMTATPGNAVDFTAVRRRLVRCRDEMGLDIREVTIDPMFATQLGQQLAEQDGFAVSEFRQTYRYYNEPCHELDAAIAQGRIRHNGHPVLRWNADCVSRKQNADGLVKPVKPDRLRSKKRIDGIVAALMGMSRAAAHRPTKSCYSDPATAIV